VSIIHRPSLRLTPAAPSQSAPPTRVPYLGRDGAADAGTEFLRFFPSQSEGPPELKTLWVTNMWPDETRPYYGNYICTQGESLWRLGLDVDVLYIRGLLSQRAYFTTLPAVRRRILDPAYRLIHVHYGHTAAMAVTTLRHPLIISFCGEDLLGAPRAHGNTLKSTIELNIFRQLPRLADATITKSLEMELSLPTRLQSRNTVLPNGVDLEMFQPRSREDARRRLGWNVEGKIVLFLGDPGDPRKNVELAQQAMRLVSRDNPDARLEIGFGFEPSMVPTLMNAANCMVFPSKSEGSPNAVKEAMASALPIVAGAVGDIPERFAGVEGCFVCEHDPAQFADAIARAIALDGAPAAREAAHAVSMDAIANRLRALYASVVGV
jgi:teichuronic acid biosynthesis glycosyltransferase TuaC